MSLFGEYRNFTLEFLVSVAFLKSVSKKKKNKNKVSLQYNSVFCFNCNNR